MQSKAGGDSLINLSVFYTHIFPQESLAFVVVVQYIVSGITSQRVSEIEREEEEIAYVYQSHISPASLERAGLWD